MSDSYYVRVRGEVKGPIARSELVSQIRKKRIGRHHEVSTDAVNWVRAGDVPDLFEPVVAVRQVVEPQPEQSSSNASPRSGAQRSGDDSTTGSKSSSSKEWFYAMGRNRLGPIPESELRTMMATGRVTGEDLVWNNSLEDWIAAGSLPQFASLAAKVAVSESAKMSNENTGSSGTILTSSLFALLFACISMLCAPLVAVLAAAIMDSPGFSRANVGAGMVGILVISCIFGACPIFSAISGIITGHQSLRLHNQSPGKYLGAGYALTALIVCYTVLIVTLVALFVFLIVFGVRSA